jgi:hypothetical protein
MFNKLRFIWGKNKKAGMASLEVPAVEGTDPKLCKNWRLVETPKEILAYLLERNRKHFGQAKGSPLTDHRYPSNLILQHLPPRANWY